MELYDNALRINYRGLCLEDVNEKHGGAFNVHGEMWQPNLVLGSMLGFGYS